jgi:hypothetical protein
MTQLSAPQPPASDTKKTGRRRRFLPPLFLNPETRSIEIGIAGTILVHLLVLLFAPRILRSNGPNTAPVHHLAKPQAFNIRMLPDEYVQPPPPKFVEANPNANNNVPVHTNNIAAQNQTVAQEKPTPNGKSDRPALQGRKDFDSTQIVTGTLEKQINAPPVAPAPVSPPKPPAPSPKAAQNPLSGFDKAQNKNNDSYGSDDSRPADNEKLTPNKVTGVQNAAQTPDATSATPQIDPRHPQPRRTLSQHARPAIFAQNDIGTSNIGLTGIDAHWDPYAEYLQRMVETIQIEWYRILDTSQIQPPVGSTVSIRFRMNSRGQITEILNVNNTSNEQGKDACLSAITNRSPYGEWTAQMIATLGNQQDMTFTFYYIGD